VKTRRVARGAARWLVRAALVGTAGRRHGGFTAVFPCHRVCGARLRRLSKSESRSIVQPLHSRSLQLYRFAGLAIQHPSDFRPDLLGPVGNHSAIVASLHAVACQFCTSPSLTSNFRRITFSCSGLSGLRLPIKAARRDHPGRCLQPQLPANRLGRHRQLTQAALRARSGWVRGRCHGCYQNNNKVLVVLAPAWCVTP